MAMLFDLAGTTAHRAHQAAASCAGLLSAQGSRYCHRPNIALHADANIGHRCALSNVGALRLRLRRR
jgi:hypothetical protein